MYLIFLCGLDGWFIWLGIMIEYILEEGKMSVVVLLIKCYEKKCDGKSKSVIKYRFCFCVRD